MWSWKGKDLGNGTKYEMQSESDDDQSPSSDQDRDVVKFYLTVKELKETDLGAYECRLSSDYAQESSQPAYINFMDGEW